MAVERDGVATAVGARRVSAALACLLVRANQSVSTDALVEAVWPDDPPAGADSTLESHLFRLRQLLEPDHQRGKPFTTVVRDAAGYRLAATTGQVDSLLFEQLAGEARDLLVTAQPERSLARCNEALTLWRGAPWAPHSDELWASASTARLYQLRSQVTRQRIESLLQLGDPESALTDVEPLLDADPLDEGLWELSMLAAYRLGRIGQALETYTRARSALIDHTGLEPGPQLRDLQSKILDHDTSLTGPARPAVPVTRPEPEVHVPSPRTKLIGRTVEVTDLLAAVSSEPLLTVVGSAGCGKTRLVIEVARQAASGFPDGVWFIDLTATNDAEQLLDTLTSTLGLAAPEVGTVTQALQAFTRTRRMLLVLDNCEHLLEEVADLVDALLDQRSETVLLATSREPLAIAGERVVPLLPLPVPTSDGDDATGLAQAPAVQLFLQSLTSAGPRPTVPSGGPEDEQKTHDLRLAAQICEAVDALPLAIELAAGQARSYTLEEILTRVRTDSASLARTGRGGSRHHATLSGAIKLSVDTLTPEELSLHQALAVVPGPVTTEVAAHLVGCSVGAAAAGLTNLVHRSMLNAIPPLRPGGPTRFAQLVTIRSQSLSVLTADTHQRLQQRRDAWVEDLMAAMPTIGHASELDWFKQIDDNLPAVRATLQHCLVEHPHRVGSFVAPRLTSYFFYRGMIVEWERWTRLAASSPGGEPFDRLVAGCCHVNAATQAGRGSFIRPWLDELESFQYPLSAAETVLLVHHMLNVVFAGYLSDEFDQSIRAAKVMRKFADDTGDPGADLFAELGQVACAAQTESAASIEPVVEDLFRRSTAAANHLAAWAAAALGVTSSLVSQRPDIGLRWSDEITQIFGEIGAEPSSAIVEMQGLLLAAGQPFEAVRTIARSRALARRAGTAWPTQRKSAEVLQAAQSQLAAADAERAYQQGFLDRG